MKATQPIPHYFSIFPTGNIPVPVCIGDLPLSNYVVSQNTLTEAVSTYLEDNPQIPGAVIVNGKQVVGIVPRYKMFERLGHRYGVELFLRKPITEMERELSTSIFVLKSQVSINMAVKLALGRSQTHIYDPIIVEFEDKSVKLLDMYILLLSQSQLSNNLSSMTSSLNNIETILSNENAEAVSTLDLIIENLGEVVPFHHVRILLQNDTGVEVLNQHHLIINHYESAQGSGIYKSVLKMNQPMVLEDVQVVPSWANWETPVNTRTWMGVPISHQNESLGVLSLARITLSPFTSNEKETALIFARYLGKLFTHLATRRQRALAIEKKYQVR